MVSPPTPKLWGEELFSKKCFSWGNKFCGANFWRVVLHQGTNDQIIPRGGGGEFHKMHFSVI